MACPNNKVCGHKECADMSIEYAYACHLCYWFEDRISMCGFNGNMPCIDNDRFICKYHPDSN